MSSLTQQDQAASVGAPFGTGSRPSGQAASRLDAAALRSLADRCEQATGPDRALDAEIAVALKLVPDDMEPANGVAWWRGKYDDRHWRPDELTGSLDAAMALLGSWHWRRLTGASVAVYRSDPAVSATMRFDGHSKTPAAAMCAAILKAKADSLDISEKSRRPSAMSAEGQDPQGLGAQPASATGEAGDGPSTSPLSSEV